MDCGTFGTLFLLLVLFCLKHLVCDGFLQFGYMFHEKGIYGAWGGIHHAMIHAVFTLFILLAFTSSSEAVLLASLDGVIHYHVDWAKKNLSVGLTVNDQMYWIWFATDQALHHLTYLGVIYLLLSL